jgi:hypothetical protein
VPISLAPALALLAGLASLQQGFTDVAPACPPKVEHCVGVELFVVLEQGRPVQTAEWFAGQLEHANRLFAAVEVGFELRGVSFLDGSWAHVPDRIQRDRLGRRERSPGVVHVFMVRRLDDVDIADNQLYGVHWRDRADVSNRWVIVSARDSSNTVLSHELGHYFGLPHSSHPESVMNKAPRSEPSWPDRVFAVSEQQRMRRKRDAMLSSGFLVETGG